MSDPTEGAASTDARRVELALQIIRTAQAGLRRAIAELITADDAGSHVLRALLLLEMAEDDLAGESGEDDTDAYPFELRRGGITFGVDREIDDDDTAAMFVIDGEIAPRIWADQALPVVGDTLQAATLGLDGDLIRVEARLWQSANLVIIGCVHFEPEPSGEVTP